MRRWLQTVLSATGIWFLLQCGIFLINPDGGNRGTFVLTAILAGMVACRINILED